MPKILAWRRQVGGLIMTKRMPIKRSATFQLEFSIILWHASSRRSRMSNSYKHRFPSQPHAFCILYLIRPKQLHVCTAPCSREQTELYKFHGILLCRLFLCIAPAFNDCENEKEHEENSRYISKTLVTVNN